MAVQEEEAASRSTTCCVSPPSLFSLHLQYDGADLRYHPHTDLSASQSATATRLRNGPVQSRVEMDLPPRGPRQARVAAACLRRRSRGVIRPRIWEGRTARGRVVLEEEAEENRVQSGWRASSRRGSLSLSLSREGALLSFEISVLTPRILHSFSSPAGPAPNGTSIPATPAKPLIPFSARPSRLTVQESLNPELPLPTSEQLVSNSARVALTATTNPADYAYRIAFERAMERSEGAAKAFHALNLFHLICAEGSELSSFGASCLFHAAVLDSLIDEAAEIFKEYYQIEELGDPTIQAQVRLSTVNGTLLAVNPDLIRHPCLRTGRNPRRRAIVPRNRRGKDDGNLNLARVVSDAWVGSTRSAQVRTRHEGPRGTSWSGRDRHVPGVLGRAEGDQRRW